MTIRWKLNLLVIALVVVFLVAAGFSLRAVRRNAEATHEYTRMRTQSQITADIRALVYQNVAAHAGLVPLPVGLEEDHWPDYLLDDIDVQIRLARDGPERQLWTELRGSVATLDRVEHVAGGADRRLDSVRRAERTLRELRNLYDTAQSELMATSAASGVVEYFALCATLGVTAVLFIVCLVMIRVWIVRPVEVLHESTRVIGQGRLDHRVPLRGQDELADLARGIDDMAERLAEHQRALVAAREMTAIGELCANVAHGLRNPLATIRATAQLAERRVRGNDRAEAMMRELTMQADRMEERIRRLFEFSRMIKPEVAPITFADLCALAVARAGPVITTRRVEVMPDDQTGASTWRMDRDHMAEAIGELITNAAYHSPEGAAIIVRGEQLSPDNGAGPLLRIQVIDRGVGMEESTLKKAFDPFFTGRESGIGMGLPLVRRIVERHGGEVTLTSALGQGTTMTVLLRNAFAVASVDTNGPAAAAGTTAAK